MDHGSKQKRYQNPRETANVFSLITFSYTLGLFKKAVKKNLNEKDLPEILQCCDATKCGDKIEKLWNDENKQHKNNPSIFRVLIKRFGRLYGLLGLATLFMGIVRSVSEPYATSNFISSFSEKGVNLKDAIFYGSLVIGVNLLNSFWFFNVIMVEHQLIVQIRNSLSSLIYRKSLKISTLSSNSNLLGNIVTLITKDVVIIEGAMWIFSDSCIAILRTLTTCYLLYNKMGNIGFVGVAFILCILPLQIFIGRKIAKLRLNIGKKTDDRLQITQATLTAIKIIKMFTWEDYFHQKISSARKKELNALLGVLNQKVISIVIGSISSRIGFYLVILAYIWSGQKTTTELIFYVLTLFQTLRHTLGVVIPYGLSQGGEMYAAIYRIGRFLTTEELPTTKQQTPSSPNIQIVDIKMQIHGQVILKNVSLTVTRGLTVVTGHVGSGKSALIKAILNDYVPIGGKITVNGRISYASQDAWLFPSSIRQNILFGEPYESNRYNEVIHTCALEYDLSHFDNGDETLVADRGLNLSRGQQARINLARAIYKKADIYLIDDSLTALDNRVQDFVFNECIRKFLNEKICILITQNAKHIQVAEQIVVLDKGGILFNGKPKDFSKITTVCKNNVEKKQLINGFKDNDEEILEGDEEEKLLNNENNRKNNTKNIYFETRKEGYVNWNVYKNYFQFGGGMVMFFIVVLLFIAAQFAENYSDKLLSEWVDLQQKVLDFSALNITNSTFLETSNETKYTINLYIIAIVSGSVLILVKSDVLYNFCRKVSINIHKKMLSSIIYAVMMFFDTNYIGNIINRFSFDLYHVDEHLPNTFSEVLRVFLALIGSTYLVVSVNYIFLIPIVVILAIQYQLRKYYVQGGRNLQRLQAAIRSPVIGYINSSLEGLTTIRAFQAESILKREFDIYQNIFSSVSYCSMTLMIAFGFFTDIINVLMITIIIIAVLYLNPDVSAGTAGLVLTQMIQLATTIHWGMTQTSTLELNMTSMERAMEYTSIECEDKTGTIIPKWPKNGKIVYRNVSLTYGKQEVLKNVSFVIEPQQKIGIVGRTGAGKSSIISTLFRLYKFQGNVLIDDIDTSSLCNSFLRQNIAIIPQDPFLFRESVRKNLDPLDQHEDSDIWNVLKQVHLDGIVSNLDWQISETGANLSAGQKQLLCLARAILRKNPIVILDEATANLDPQNEQLLQSVINENFSKCTVITVAHRLTSIMNCDKVMVLKQGEIVEFDSPVQLLRDNTVSLFSKMVDRSNISHVD